VSGVVDLKRKRYEEDLHFEVSGSPFRWKQFRLQQLAGNVDWVGQVVSLTNVQGAFRTGRILGEGRFDFSVPKEADFNFKVVLAEADLREIMAEFSSKTDRIEGIFSGDLVITNANTSDRQSWQGYGRVHLRDGVLWDIPMFGIFSPVLNAFVPGLGNSRAREATATLLVSNSVVSTSDLEIHATAMRMQFEGKVDWERRVEARVEAELLRDVPALGLVISKVLWPVTKLFEYKVTGTLDQPKAEPVYVLPKILLLPLQPLKMLKDLFEEEKNPTHKPAE
jgi:hypothetical protein